MYGKFSRYKIEISIRPTSIYIFLHKLLTWYISPGLIYLSYKSHDNEGHGSHKKRYS